MSIHDSNQTYPATVQIVAHFSGPDGCTKYTTRRILTPATAQTLDRLLNHNEDDLPIEGHGHYLGETRPVGVKCNEHS